MSALPPCEEDKNIPRAVGTLPAASEGRGIARQSQNPMGGSADGEPPAPQSADMEPSYLKLGFPSCKSHWKIPGAFIPFVLISYTQNKMSLFLSEYSRCTENKTSVFEGFIFPSRHPGAWKSICPECHQSNVQPQMSPLSPGMGDTTWDAQKGPGGIKPPPPVPQTDTVLPGVPSLPAVLFGNPAVLFSTWLQAPVLFPMEKKTTKKPY